MPNIYTVCVSTCVAVKKDGLCVEAHDTFITMATHKSDFINSRPANTRRRREVTCKHLHNLHWVSALSWGRVVLTYGAMVTYENIRIYNRDYSESLLAQLDYYMKGLN